jgi:cold shock CspA family protein
MPRIDVSERSLSELVAEYQLDLARRGRRPSTSYRYFLVLREFSEIAAQNQSRDRVLDSLRSEVLKAYVRRLEERALAPASIAARLAQLATFLRWAGDRSDGLRVAEAIETVGELRWTFVERWGAIPGEGHRRGSGTIRSVVSDRGFGFIASDDGKEYFFHRGGLGDSLEFDRLVGGEVVRFDVEHGPKGPIAANIRSRTHVRASNSAEANSDFESSVDLNDVTTSQDAPRRRYLNVRGPDRVEPRSELQVDACIARRPAGGASGGLGDWKVPKGGINIRLVAMPTGMKVVGAREQIVHVPEDGDSPWAPFVLASANEGIHSVEILALNGATQLGSVVLRVAVAANVGDQRQVGRTCGIEDRPRDPGEVSLLVSYDQVGDEGKVLQYHLIHDAAFPFAKVDEFVPDPSADVAKLVDFLGQLAEDSVNLSPSLKARKIRNEGKRLWSRLLPELLREQFWAVADNMTRLNILSADDPVPWELLLPVRGTEDRGFLVEWCEVMRWRTRGVRLPRLRLPLGDTAFVLPSDSPPAAGAEVAALRALNPIFGKGRDVTTGEALVDLLEVGGFDVLHFATHNGFNGSTSAVLVNDEEIDTSFLQPAIDGTILAARSPLVFMNACHSAKSAPVYTQIDGWAQGFMQAGAGAFIGTLWLVRDTTAREFAEAFYGSLLDGKALGVAMRQGRKAAQSTQGDPTWLAYAAYGDPTATLA